MFCRHIISSIYEFIYFGWFNFRLSAKLVSWWFQLPSWQRLRWMPMPCQGSTLSTMRPSRPRAPYTNAERKSWNKKEKRVRFMISPVLALETPLTNNLNANFHTCAAGSGPHRARVTTKSIGVAANCCLWESPQRNYFLLSWPPQISHSYER